MQENLKELPKIVQTDMGAKNGQNKCPRCGTTDISLNINEGTLRCNFCRLEFEPQKVEGLEEDLTKLEGEIIGSGAQDIEDGAEDIITLKCSSCGAEVVIDTSEVTYARCHWCRNTLTINQQVPNGAIPDMVLPFKVTREEAKKQIANFVKKRKLFAGPRFKKEFALENIMGVYLPYMVVDVNSHAYFKGKVGNKHYKSFDFDIYDSEREFDLTISGLTVESSGDKLDKNATDKTTNIINSIMPFDIENSVKWNANYLKGYSLEKRDINIDELRPLVDSQIKDIVKKNVNDLAFEYKEWDIEQIDIKGKQWNTAYLPVWLCSYQEINNNGEKILHYIAVNARTKEIMGSVPVHKPKVLLWYIIIGILIILLSIAQSFLGDLGKLLVGAFLCIVAVKAIGSYIEVLEYRNKDAKHNYETETKVNIYNMEEKIEFKEKRIQFGELKIKK